MTTKSRPSVARRPARRRPARRSGLRYRQTRATLVLMFFVVFFGWLWLLNGAFTASFVMSASGQTVLVGWSVHCFLSLVEIAPVAIAPYVKDLPRRIVVLLWFLSLPFGVFDVLSSAVGIAPYMLWTHADGVFFHLQNTIMAEFIGFAPERMIVWLAVAIAAVVRSRA